MQDQLQDVEGIVDQLNDTSTQPGAQVLIEAPNKEDLETLKDQIKAVEKQLHAAIGAKIKSDITGNKET